MISFNALIEKFNNQGEKTGWTYIVIPAALAQKINPGVKKSYRIKGQLDHFKFSGMNLLPMGEGDFILALNGDVRKAIRKKQGDQLNVKIELDRSKYKLNSELTELLDAEPKAHAHFYSLPVSHQNYFSKWIESAKTTTTRHERLASTINAMINKLSYAEMLRERKRRDER